MNDFHKIANEILQIPEENLSWEERLNELVKFRAYDFKKEVLSKDYNLDGLNYLLVNILFKYKLAIEDYNEYVNLLKEKHDVELKADWEKILSEKDLDLLEALSLLTFLQRSDYWDYEHMPLSYAIFDGTVDNILESIENHIDEENIEFLNIFVK